MKSLKTKNTLLMSTALASTLMALPAFANDYQISFFPLPVSYNVDTFQLSLQSTVKGYLNTMAPACVGSNRVLTHMSANVSYNTNQGARSYYSQVAFANPANFFSTWGSNPREGNFPCANGSAEITLQNFQVDQDFIRDHCKMNGPGVYSNVPAANVEVFASASDFLTLAIHTFPLAFNITCQNNMPQAVQPQVRELDNKMLMNDNQAPQEGASINSAPEAVQNAQPLKK